MYKAKTIKPWFWKGCCVCGDEMKREPVHEISMRWFEKLIDGGIIRCPSGETDKFYFCDSCAPTLADAEKYFKEKLFPSYHIRTKEK